MLLTICQAGEIVLRQPSRPLAPEEILSDPIQELITSMFETMRGAPGVGLAAPQIGMPLQLAVIEDRQDYIDKLTPEHASERLRTAVAPHVIINPRLTIENPAKVQFFEGCLSLPGFTAIVPRALGVRVDCLNERAEPVTIQAHGWYARILQHEIDHLHGTLYIDRMLTRSFMGRENYERYWKDLPVFNFRLAIQNYIAREAKPVEKFGHQPRLYALTQQVGAGHDYDDDVVFAAAWLHDIGVFTGHRPEDLDALARWDNVAYAVEHAPALLEDMGFPRDKIAAVIEAIRTHQPTAHPATIEGIILRDADILEQLGAIGVLRTASKIGRDTRFPTFTAALESLKNGLATLPPLIRLDTTRTLAQPKIKVMESFLAAVEEESQGALC